MGFLNHVGFLRKRGGGKRVFPLVFGNSAGSESAIPTSSMSRGEAGRRESLPHGRNQANDGDTNGRSMSLGGSTDGTHKSNAINNLLVKRWENKKRKQA